MVVVAERPETENVVDPAVVSWSKPMSLANGHSRVRLAPRKTTRDDVTKVVPVSTAVGTGSPWT